LKVFSDSDWAGDPETRIGVTGFIIYLQKVSVCWRPKAQRGVTLSSSKAEYHLNRRLDNIGLAVLISDFFDHFEFIHFMNSWRGD
jgi:hypothetical protein